MCVREVPGDELCVLWCCFAAFHTQESQTPPTTPSLSEAEAPLLPATRVVHHLKQKPDIALQAPQIQLPQRPAYVCPGLLAPSA